MEPSERALLLERRRDSYTPNSELCLAFAIICIIDVFGVFPIVALPKTIIDCGLSGIFLIIIVCSLQIYTAILLGKCWIMAEEVEPTIRFKNRYPYAALAEITYGKNLSKVATLLLDLTILGGGIPNLILSSQNLQFVGLKLSNNTFDVSFCYWIIILGIIMCPFLWLGSPKDMKLLCTISVMTVLLVFVLIISSILTSSEIDPTTSTQVNMHNGQIYLWQSLLTGYGIVTFQFDIHPTILTIQVDMKNKFEINKAVIGGFLVSLVFFSITCLGVYIHFGTHIGPSILEMLPSTFTVHVAATLVALQLILSSAISNSALYQHIEDCMGIPRDFNHRRCIVRSILAVLSILIAESVPRFDMVMSLLGGALTGPLVFILPPLFYMKMLSLKKLHIHNLEMESVHNKSVDEKESSQNSLVQIKASSVNQKIEKVEMAFCALIIITGMCATLATTYWNVVNTIRYVSFSPPCIVSIYNSSVFNE